MTKNEREFIVSTIAGKPREVSGEAFMELNRLLYETSIDKTCENCEHYMNGDGHVYPEICLECKWFHIDKFSRREQDAD